MKFRIDDFSYGGENGADHWIAISIKDRQEVAHGDATFGDGLIVLNRGAGDGNATCLPHLDVAGDFTPAGTAGIKAEVDSKGREIYTFTLDYVEAKNEWVFAMNGYTFSTITTANGISLEEVFNGFEKCEGYVAVTLMSSVKEGSAALTILEFNGEAPFGEDSAEAEANANTFAEIADPSTVAPNQPAIIWDSTLTSISRLSGGVADFSVNEADQTVIMKATGLKPIFTEQGNVLFEQARLSLECKKLYTDTIKPECFLDKESLEKWYDDAHGGFHKMYIVEIENIWEGD